MGHTCILALVGSLLYYVARYNRTMKLIITTIDQGKVAIVETSSEADTKRGERYVSEDCLKVNLESGLFRDVSDKGWNAEGRLYLMRD